MLDLSAIAKSFLKHTDRVVWQANLGSPLGDVKVRFISFSPNPILIVWAD